MFSPLAEMLRVYLGKDSHRAILPFSKPLPGVQITTVLASFTSVSDKLESSERREPQLRKCLRYTRLEGVFSVVDVGGSSPLWVGGTIPG